MKEKMDLVDALKARGDLMNEISYYNTAYSINLTPKKIVPDKEKQNIEQWLLYLRNENNIRKTTQLIYIKDIALR